MRVGRKVKHGQDPMKWVKQRAMTLNRRREVELAKQNGEEQMQGLYAEWQTEVFTPPPIVNVSTADAGNLARGAQGGIGVWEPLTKRQEPPRSDDTAVSARSAKHGCIIDGC